MGKRSTATVQGTRNPARRSYVLIALAFLVLATILYTGCGLGPDKPVSANKPAAEDSSEAATRLSSPESVPVSMTIPNGTVLSVRLLETISSRTARSGQEFAAELASPLIVQGSMLFPKGSRARGRVVTARESGRLHEPGYLRLTLDGLQIPDGKWIDLHTTSISAQGRSHKKRDWTMIGGGAGLGAVVGGLAGGGRGVAIGAASGAGAGTAAAYATGKEEVTLAAERKLRFTTIEEVVMNR